MSDTFRTDLPESVPTVPQESQAPGGQMGHLGTFGDIDGTVDPLSEIQRRAVDLTVLGHSDAQIAASLGLNRKTLWRWKSLDYDYQEALEIQRYQMRSAVDDRYLSLVSRAADVMAYFLDQPGEDNRFRAAQMVLAMAGSFRSSSRFGTFDGPRSRAISDVPADHA